MLAIAQGPWSALQSFAQIPALRFQGLIAIRRPENRKKRAQLVKSGYSGSWRQSEWPISELVQSHWGKVASQGRETLHGEAASASASMETETIIAAVFGVGIRAYRQVWIPARDLPISRPLSPSVLVRAPVIPGLVGFFRSPKDIKPAGPPCAGAKPTGRPVLPGTEPECLAPGRRSAR